jgi:hypothetical protein
MTSGPWASEKKIERREKRRGGTGWLGGLLGRAVHTRAGVAAGRWLGRPGLVGPAPNLFFLFFLFNCLKNCFSFWHLK